MRKIAIIGDAYTDLIFKPKILPSIGEAAISDVHCLQAAGSGGYAALALSALGSEVRLICNLGTDPLSNLWSLDMVHMGVDITHVRIIEGGFIGVSAVLLHSGDRCFISDYGANKYPMDKLRIDEIADSELILITGFMQVPGMWNMEFIRFVEAIEKLGITIALDTNDDPNSAALIAARNVLKYADIFIPNRSELYKISGVCDLAKGVKALRNEYHKLRAVIVKLGQDGAFVYVPEAHIEEIVPAQAVNTVENANGAGDVFDAAYLLSYLRSGDFLRSADYANQCAAKVIGMFGANRFEGLRSLNLGDIGKC